MNIKLSFGLRDGQLVDIATVDSGLACNCVCPSCGQQLVAKKGDVKEHHFAHHDSEECSGAVETALHIYAKNILQRNKRIVLPRVYWDNSDKLIYPATEITFDNVALEKRISNIIPDIVVTVKGKPLLIEVAVTHFIDRFKAYKMYELGYSAIEVNADGLFNSTYNKPFGHDDFEKRLIEDTSFKRWINNTKKNFIDNEIKKLATNKSVIHSGLDAYPFIVDNCPIDKRKWKSGYKQGQSYASVFEDCYNCPFGEVIHDKKYSNGGTTIINRAIRSVNCSGHKEEEVDSMIAKFTEAK